MTITFKEVATAIRTALLADTNITNIVSSRIYRGLPSSGAAFPLIRMHPQAPSDDIGNLGARVYQFFYISVIAVSQDADEADSISALIDAALERVSLTVAGTRVGTSVRQGDIWFQDKDGEIYTRSGGIYRIGVRA